jgi:DNA-binding transcriptional ArsR family regulator
MEPTNDLLIDTLTLKKAAGHLRAINHKLRQQMLHLLHQNVRMTVTQLYVKLRLEQSVASQHLAILRKAKLVNAERDGKFIFYSVNYQTIKEMHQTASDLLA